MLFMFSQYLHVDEGHLCCHSQTPEYHLLYQQLLYTFHMSGLFSSEKYLETFLTGKEFPGICTYLYEY